MSRSMKIFVISLSLFILGASAVGLAFGPQETYARGQALSAQFRNWLTPRDKQKSPANAAMTTSAIAPVASMASGGYTVTQASAPIIYVDCSNGNQATYIAFFVQNNTGSNVGDVWAKLTPAAGDIALSEDGTYHIGAIANGAVKTAYFYLKVNNCGNKATAQNLTVDLYTTPPPFGSAVSSDTFGYTVEDQIKAVSNKVTVVTATPNPSYIGAYLVMQATGFTGNIGSGARFNPTPASTTNWPADIYKLSDVTISFYDTGVSNESSCTYSGVPTTFTDRLIVENQAPVVNGNTACYKIDYKFVIQQLTSTNYSVVPLTWISSGAQIKHNDPAAIASTPQILPATESTTLSKSASTTSATANGVITYTITATNTGTSDVFLDSFEDTLPSGVTYNTNSSQFASSAIPDPVTVSGTTVAWNGVFRVPANSTASLTYSITLPSNVMCLSFVNSAVAFVGTGVGRYQIDTTLSTADNSPATVTVFDTSCGTDLAITKSNGASSVTAGGTTTYTLTITNDGPALVTGALLTDPAVANLTVTNVSCTGGTGGANCPGSGVTVGNLQGSGISVDLPASSSLTFTVAGTIASTATGTLANTATITPPMGTPDLDLNDNSATDTDSISIVADLSITKTDGVTSVNAGGSTTYTLTIANAGPSAVTNALLTDPSVTNLTVSAVNCTGGTGGATCPGSGVSVANLQGGGIAVDLPSGGSLTFTVAATVAGVATGNIANTAAIAVPSGTTDPTPANNSATDTNSVTPVADLSITKTDGVTSVNAGGSTTYTLTIANAGLSAVTNALLTDPAVTNLTVSAVNCTGGTGGATCPGSGVSVANLQGGGIAVDLPSGGSLTFTVAASVAGVATGNIANTAVIAVPSGTTDPTPGNNSATDTNSVTPVADLSITKTDGVTSVNAGGSTTYTLTIANAGPSAVTNALLTDPAVTNLTVSAVNCTGGTGGATCPGSGVSVANLQGGGIAVDLPSGGSLTFTVAASVAGVATGNIANTAVIAVPSGTTDPTPGNNSATDTNSVTPVADLSITKTDGAASVNAGGSTTYTLTIANAGPSAVTNALLTDPAVTNLTVSAVNCTAGTGGATCPGSGVSVVNLQGGGIAVDLPSGGSLTFTVAATVAGVATGNIANTAVIAVPSGTTDPTPGNNSATDTNSVTPVADLSITKTDGAASVNAGGSTTYTLVISNAGPSAVTGALLTDPAVTNLTVTNISCTGGTGGATCPGSGVTFGNLQGGGISVDLPASGSLTFTVAATVAGAATGTIANTATIAVPMGTTDPTPGNNSATDTNNVTPVADLSVTKTDSAASVNAGGSTTYTLVISNAGPSAVTGALLTDPAVTNLTVTNVSCTGGTGGASCPGSGVTVGNLQGGGIAVDLPSGGSLTFTASGTLASTATGSIANTAVIAVPSGTTDPTPSNNSATDTDTVTISADLSITKTNSVSSLTAGTNTTYTLTISNAGPSAITGAMLTDPAVTNLTVTNVACTGGTGSAACPVSGVTVANLQGAGISVNLPVSGTLTFTVTATLSSTATGSIANTATITVPGGATDPTPGNNSATDTDTVTISADLSITKTDGATSVNAGGSTTYTLVVSNAGPSAITGALVTDPVVTLLTLTSVSCGSATGGASCPGSGVTVSNLQGGGISVNLPVSGSLTFTVAASVAGPATGTIANTATIAVPSGATDPTPGNNSATDTNSVTPVADLSVIKTDSSPSVSAGGITTYTLTISNAGPSAVTNALLTDPAVTSLTVNAVSCTSGAGGATCPGSGVTVANLQGSGISVNLPSGGSLTFAVAASVAANATGSIINTAAIAPPSGTTDPTPNNNSSSDNNTVVVAPVLSKSFGAATVPLNGTVALSFTVTSPAANTIALTGVSFTDNLPTGLVVATPNGLTGSCGGTVTATAGSNSISLSGGTVAANSTCSFSVNVTGTTAGVKDNVTGNVTSANGGQGNTATASITVVAPPTIVKAFGSANILLNGTSSLSFTLTNPNTTVALTGVAFTDPLPAGLVVATPSNLSGACGGTVTAVAGSSSISLANGTIAASGSCTISLNVTATTSGAKNNTTSAITSTNGGTGTTSNTATLNIGVLGSSITDPAVCVGPGGVVSVSVSATNGAASSQSATITSNLPSTLLALPGTCTASTGTCAVVNSSTVTLNATLSAGQTVTLSYQAQVADQTLVGTQMCVNSTVSFNSGPLASTQACTTATCPAIGPGALPSNNQTLQQSDQMPGSVLVYNLYSSNAASPNSQNTRFSLTNIHGAIAAYVHLFYLDGTNCSIADSYICLTPNQTASFLASDIDPGTTGYLIAVAVDRTGCPISFNYLIGDEFVKLSTGHAANLSAEAFMAVAGGWAACNPTDSNAVLNFDGTQYARAPRTLALDNINDRASGNDTLLVLNRFGGNLASGVAPLSSFAGLLFDDAERAYSFGFTPGSCQFRASLTNAFPRTAPRFEQVIPAGRTGWMKLWLANDEAALGAAINMNTNATSQAGAFNQGHNLHKLTQASTAQLTIPVFPPSC